MTYKEKTKVVLGVLCLVLVVSLVFAAMDYWFDMDRQSYLYRRSIVTERCENRLGFARSRTDTILVANGGCWEYIGLRYK